MPNIVRLIAPKGSLEAGQCTEVRFASLLSGEFITAIVVNPPERKLAKRTAGQCCQVLCESNKLLVL